MVVYMVMWLTKYSCSHVHPVATTPDLKQKLQAFIESNSADPKKRLSTSETITRGNLGFFVFLSALSAKALYFQTAQSLLRC